MKTENIFIMILLVIVLIVALVVGIVSADTTTMTDSSVSLDNSKYNYLYDKFNKYSIEPNAELKLSSSDIKCNSDYCKADINIITPSANSKTSDIIFKFNQKKSYCYLYPNMTKKYVNKNILIYKNVKGKELLIANKTIKVLISLNNSCLEYKNYTDKELLSKRDKFIQNELSNYADRLKQENDNIILNKNKEIITISPSNGGIK